MPLARDVEDCALLLSVLAGPDARDPCSLPESGGQFSAGLPAVSVPAGFTASGLPVGLQIVGPPRDDAAVLGAARVFEQATGFGKWRPQL